MLEIILLIFLTRETGKLAARKGLKAITWKLYTISGWILFEFIGVLAGILLFGQNNLISVMIIGIAFAITSYFLIKAYLEKMPDSDLDDDIYDIGRN